MSDVPVVSGIVGVGIALFGRLWAPEQRLNRLSRLDAKVDALLKHAGADFDPSATSSRTSGRHWNAAKRAWRSGGSARHPAPA